MPVPIRPVRDIEQNIPSAMMGEGFGSLSPLQQMFLDQNDVEAQMMVKKITKVDMRDAENLHKIWLANDEFEVKASNSNEEEEIRLFVPSDIPDYELMKLKTNGLVVGNGRRVTPTKKGNKILRDTILKAPSDLQMNRTREKYRSEPED